MRAGYSRKISFGLIATALVVSAAQEPPVIRIDTRLVQVDVVVRNGKGPVAGLSKDDFTLLEKGKPREIALFKVTDARTAQTPGEPAAPLPPGVVSNRATQSGEAIQNATVVLVDHLNTPTEAQIYGNKQVFRFLQSSQKGDRIAIYQLSEAKLEVIENFTTDLDRLRQAASKLTPDDSWMNVLLRSIAEGGVNTLVLAQLEAMHTDYATATANALTAIAKNLAGLPGRKTLVWISSTFPMGIRLQSRNMRYFTPELQEATRMLNEANVAVYPINPRGLATFGKPASMGGRGNPPGDRVSGDPLVSEDSNEIVTMNTVAQATGGRAFYNDNGVSEAIRDAIDDGEVTYTLGFYSDAGMLDGAFHNLAVKVAKSGVDVRYRKGYFASTGAAPAEAQLRDALKETIGSPLDATAVGITAGGEPDPAAPGNYKLTAKVNLNDVRMERGAADAGWTGSIVFAFRPEADQSGKFQFAVVPIKLTDEQYKAALTDGFEVRSSINIGAASGRVRAMVQDQKTGAAGSVWIPLGMK
jgi:VWFA-related protein